ncbi:hypothetical protein HY251_01130, partial [bacterium]|nr:hypothetical protein [bacterium]
LIVALGFKVSAVPFHFWAPDVYQGASTPVTAWLSVTSKAAGIGLFTRFLAAFMSFPYVPARETLESSLLVNPTAGPTGALVGFDWTSAVIVLSAVTMTIGNFGAIFQTSMKRLLAYSSVAHVGYILMGLAAIQATLGTSGLNTLELAVHPAGGAYETSGVQASGGAAVAFYIAAYLFMNVGAFACVIAVQNATGTDDLSSFRALGRRAPALALALAIFIFALIGLPPTAGFTGKLQLFMAAIARAEHRPSFWVLVAIAGVNTAVSVYYYLRVAKVMYFDGLLEPEAREPLPASPALTIVSLVLILPVLCFGLAFNRIVELTMGLEILRS